MARIRDVRNQWGKASMTNPQRADLWQVDLSAVVNGVNAVIGNWVPSVPRYFAAAIALPEMKVRPERVGRDSRVYNMPSWDEPLEAISISFIVDDGGLMTRQQNEVPQSLIYKVLDMWRRVVRAGRGAVGAEQAIQLNLDYTINYAFPVYLYLCKGYPLPATSFTTSTRLAPNESPTNGRMAVSFGGDSRTMITDTNDEEAITRAQHTEVLADTGQLFNSQMEEGLFISGIYTLEYAWLSGFKIAPMTYQGSTVLTVEAQIYAENILVTTTDPLDSAPS